MTLPSRRDDGFALVTALWAALILALVASAIVLASRTDARISRTMTTRARQHAAAQGILNLVKLRLLGPEAGSMALDGTPFPVPCGGYTGQVTLQDQSGLVDLNSTAADTLIRLLTIAGSLDRLIAETMADRILDWRERGVGRRLNGAKAEEYAAAGYQYGPRESPFESVAELKLVLGMTPALYQRIAPALTVYAQKPMINAQVAPAVVLPVLPNLDAGAIDTLLAERARRHAEGTSASSAIGYVAGQAVGIEIRIGSAARVLSREETVVRITGNPSAPVWVYQAAD